MFPEINRETFIDDAVHIRRATPTVGLHRAADKGNITNDITRMGRGVAARYGEQLSLRAEECGMRARAQAAADEEKRAAERPQVMRAYGRALRSFAVVAALFLAFAVASAVLFPLIDAVPGYQVLIAAVVCGAAALVLLVAAAALGRRFWRAFSAKRRNERAGSTPEGRLARLLAEEEECIRMVLEDIM